MKWRRGLRNTFTKQSLCSKVWKIVYKWFILDLGEYAKIFEKSYYNKVIVKVWSEKKLKKS